MFDINFADSLAGHRHQVYPTLFLRALPRQPAQHWLPARSVANAAAAGEMDAKRCMPVASRMLNNSPLTVTKCLGSGSHEHKCMFNINHHMSYNCHMHPRTLIKLFSTMHLFMTANSTGGCQDDSRSQQDAAHAAAWHAIRDVTARLEAGGAAYCLRGEAAAFVQGVQLPGLRQVEVAVQWVSACCPVLPCPLCTLLHWCTRPPCPCMIALIHTHVNM